MADILPLERRAGPSYGRVPLAALDADPRLRAETWRLLVALCGFADNKTGRCWPSRRRLAKRSKIKQRNLGRNFRDLTAAGLVRINGLDDYTVLFKQKVEPEQHRFEADRHRFEPEQHTVEPEQHRFEPDRHRSVPPYIEEQLNEHLIGTTHSTTRARANESVVEILSPSEVERADQFELLWLKYPSRPDDPKELAHEAFDQLVSKGIDPNSLIAAAVRYAGWVKRDLNGGAYVPHLHRWLAEGRYQHDNKSWPRPRQSIIGIAADFIQSGPLFTGESECDSGRSAPVFWTDRLEQLERTGIWSADWGPPPDDPACQLPPRFFGKPCVRRWREHKANGVG